jgi:glycine/D-amino acid oxidase-like deaminating enzyme
MTDCDVDYLIIGAGFYGCSLALFLRSISKKVILIESNEEIMSRASRINQARVHTGFHYPRSALTAVKSLHLHNKFIHDFREAIVDDFKMLYAISRNRSKINSKRFFKMYQDIGAPLSKASPEDFSLFNSDLIEDVFVCREAAFNFEILRQLILIKLENAEIDIRYNTTIKKLNSYTKNVTAELNNGAEINAKYIFNVTYSNINQILQSSDQPLASLKHEFAEIALVKPPIQLANLGITTMDGPFFSSMPYPAKKLHSFTHVRYTPHRSWIDEQGTLVKKDLPQFKNQESLIHHMLRDGMKYLPCLKDAEYIESLFEIKTVLLKNEIDDGRPILFQTSGTGDRIISILGGKIDNIYDLFELITHFKPQFSEANNKFLL